jgi:hypothetical protein
MRGIFVGVLLVFVVMLVIKDGRLLHGDSVNGGCRAVAAPAGDAGSWQACETGTLDAAPDLRRQGCTSMRVAGKTTYWRCPASLAPDPRG